MMNQYSRLNVKWCLFLLLIFLNEVCGATYLDLNTLYFSDQFTATNTTKIGRTQYDLGLGFDITKSRQLILALASGATSLTDTTTTATVSFAISDLGLKLIYFFDKAKAFSVGISYNLISTAKYNDGTTEVELRGSSTKVDLGYNFWLVDTFAIGLRFFSYSATYKESVTNNTISKVAYTRTLIYPSLSLVYNW
jgi:hypothetical protein